MGKFSDLPAEIMLDIFTRLPPELVLDCKLVSKTWKKVVHHPSFSQMHTNLLIRDLAHDSGKLGFVVLIYELSKPCSKQLCYLEYDDVISSHRVKKLNFKPPFELYIFIGSCNGLLCIIGLPNHYTIDNSTSASYVAYICNPITRECITLPELDRSTYYHRVDTMLHGFGYVASTNEYKVVRLYTFKWAEHNKFAEIEVYTLGSGKGWRNVGKIYAGSIVSRHAVFANGYLYWDFQSWRIMAFDLANEIFRESDELSLCGLSPGVLGGYLRVTHDSEDGRSSDIWLLKKKENESFRWSKEFSLTNTDSYNFPLTLTGGGNVLCCSDTKLYLYDPKSSSSMVLKDFGRMISNTIPHINSLISLKAFGEENTKSLESGESTIEEAEGRDW